MNGASSSPFHLALERYAASVRDRDVEAFAALYDADVHVFDMWERWQLRGIDARRAMAREWFASLGDERVLVTFAEAEASVAGGLVVGHAIATYTAQSAAGETLRSLDSRMTMALRHRDSAWLIFHEHSSAPIDLTSLKANLQLDSDA